MPLGVLAAVASRPLAGPGRSASSALLGYSVPVFWLGLVGLLVFYAKLGWVAGPGRLDVSYDDMVDAVTGLILIDSLLAGDWDVFWNAVCHIDPAGLDPRLSLARLYRPHDAQLHARPAQQEYITGRPGQGPVARGASSGATPSAISWCR